MDKDLPVNHGFYQYVRITAPLGSVTNCLHPAPVVGGWETHVRVNDLIFKALSVSLPDEVPAGTKAMQCHSGFGGEHPRTGEYYCYLETLAGGYGARSSSDGPDAVQAHGQNTENAPVEELESNYPLRIDRYGLIRTRREPGSTAADSAFAAITCSRRRPFSPYWPTATGPGRMDCSVASPVRFRSMP